jgi:hypothetical protein
MDVQVSHTQVVFRIMRDQGSAVEQCGCRNPCIGDLDAAAIRSRRYHHGSPPDDQVAGRRHRHKTCHELLEALDPVRTPLGQ